MIRISSRTQRTLRLTLLGLGLGVVVLVALITSGGGVAGATKAQSNSEYTVLQRPATAEDRRFAAASEGLKVAAREESLGVDVDGTRVIRSDAGKSFAIVPATTAPCIVSDDDAVSCGTPTAPATVQVRYGSALGVVPDSIKSVSFTLTDGTTTTKPVANNVWEAPGNAASATVAIGGQSQTIELMPEGSLPEGAAVAPDGTVTIRKPGS